MNVATRLSPTRAFMNAIGRGLRVDNHDLAIMVVNHDGSTALTLTVTGFKRINGVQIFDWDGIVVTPTVSTTPINTNVLTITGLPADVKGLTVLVSGSKA